MKAAPHLPISNHRAVLLTGATGIVGSHVLYELLVERLAGTCTGHLYLLVRTLPFQATEPAARIHRLLQKPHIPEYLYRYDLVELLQHITVISCDFTVDDLSEPIASIAESDLFVIHAAASTNLSPDAEAEQENHKSNYLGSERLLLACKHKCVRFTYISTAYSCGIQTGGIPTDYSQLAVTKHRNPYEANKYASEQMLAAHCAELGIDLQVLRPGVVVSRLLDAPLYYMPRFNVIFAFAAFFYGLQQKGYKDQIPIMIRAGATMHLIPLDYVAKAIARLYKEPSITACNIVPSRGYEVKPLIELMLREVGYQHYCFTSKKAVSKSKMVQIYQSRVEPSFGPYIMDSPYTFETSELQSVMHDVPLPDIPSLYAKMMSVAVERGFSSNL